MLLAPATWIAAQGIAAEILLALAKRLERKARFLALGAKNAPKFRIINAILNRL
jgi:hypothetical protein